VKRSLYVGSLTPLVEDQRSPVVLQMPSIFGALHFFQSMNFQPTLAAFSAEGGRALRFIINTDLTNHFHVQYMKGSIQLKVDRACFLINIAGLNSGLQIDYRPHPRQFGQKPKLGYS
jgi:hypothetical protein